MYCNIFTILVYIKNNFEIFEFWEYFLFDKYIASKFVPNDGFRENFEHENGFHINQLHVIGSPYIYMGGRVASLGVP
jgi:hypothetical protein